MKADYFRLIFFLLPAASSGCDLLPIFDTGGGSDTETYDCPAESSLAFGSYACPWYSSSDESPNSLVFAIGDDDYAVYEVTLSIHVEVDDEGEQDLTKVLTSSRETEGTRIFGVTMPGASYADTEVEMRATVELDNYYVIDNICDYTGGAVWVDVDGTRLDGDDRGSGSDCYYRYTY